MKLAYLIPEWPGLSHVWAWREIRHLREFGVEVSIFSTRLPTSKNAGRHTFAKEPGAEAFYLWPMNVFQIISDVFWAMTHNFSGFMQAVKVGFTLPVDKKPSWIHVLPLVIPACRFAREAHRQGIQHFHTPIAANSTVICMMVKRMIDTKFSLTVVAAFTDWGGAMQEKLDDADFLGFVAEWQLKEMDEFFPTVDKEKQMLIRHGADSQFWTPLPEGEEIERGEHPRIVSIGRIAFNKGYDVLLKALAMVKERGQMFECRIAGHGPYVEQIQAIIKELGLENEVTMLGGLTEEECRHEARRADMFALASYKEPLGVVYQEAMSVGLPTIGTSAGGVGDVIKDGENGLLVPPYEVEPLADAIMRLIEDPGLRKRLGEAGRKTVVANFDCRIGARTLRDQICKAHGLEIPTDAPSSQVSDAILNLTTEPSRL